MWRRRPVAQPLLAAVVGRRVGCACGCAEPHAHTTLFSPTHRGQARSSCRCFTAENSQACRCRRRVHSGCMQLLEGQAWHSVRPRLDGPASGTAVWLPPICCPPAFKTAAVTQSREAAVLSSNHELILLCLHATGYDWRPRKENGQPAGEGRRPRAGWYIMRRVRYVPYSIRDEVGI